MGAAQVQIVRHVIYLHKQHIAHATVAVSARREHVAFDKYRIVNGAVFVMNYAVHTGYGRM